MPMMSSAIFIFMLIQQYPFYNTFMLKGKRATTFNRIEMMGNGFGASQNTKKITKTNDVIEKDEKTLKGDGSSYIRHCVSLDRKFAKMKCIHNDPPIFEIEDFLSETVCDEFIDRADKEGLAIPSQVYTSVANIAETCVRII